MGGQAPRRRPRPSSPLSSSGVPALPPSASCREAPQARPTRVGLTRDTTHNTLCPQDPDPVGPGGACASTAKALRGLPQPDCEATVTGKLRACVCARGVGGYCTARASNIQKTCEGLKGRRASSSGRRDSQPSLLRGSEAAQTVPGPRTPGLQGVQKWNYFRNCHLPQSHHSHNLTVFSRG